MAGKRKDENLSVTVPTQNHVAYFFNVPISRIDNWRRGVDAMPGRNDDGTWDLHAIFHWWLRKHSPKAQDGGEGNSPALERMRSEKAIVERLKRQRMENSLMERADVHEGLGALADMIRKTGERLERNFGIEAREHIDEMLDEFTSYVDRTFADDSPDEDITETDTAL